MEVNLNDDPMTYETRPVFGYWSKRQALVGGLLVVVVLACAFVGYRIGADPTMVGGVAAIVAVPVGMFCLARRHSLLPEKWVPLEREEKSAPRERVWTPPRVVVGTEVTKGPKQSRAERRRLAKVRRHEQEGEDLLGRKLAEVEGDDDGQA